MDDDHSWLKNPILPRPPALPRFSAAELRLVDEERPSSVMRVAPRKERAARDEASRRISTTTRTRDTRRALESDAPRRIA
jgi:hypothetical protein